MTRVGLQRSSVLAVIGERVAASVAENVGMNLERHIGREPAFGGEADLSVHEAKLLGGLVTPAGFEPAALSLEGASLLYEIKAIPTSFRFVHGSRALFDFNLSEWAFSKKRKPPHFLACRSNLMQEAPANVCYRSISVHLSTIHSEI
jgi:hypothetical protein